MFPPHFFGMTIAPFASRFFGLAKKKMGNKRRKELSAAVRSGEELYVAACCVQTNVGGAFIKSQGRGKLGEAFGSKWDPDKKREGPTINLSPPPSQNRPVGIPKQY